MICTYYARLLWQAIGFRSAKIPRVGFHLLSRTYTITHSVAAVTQQVTRSTPDSTILMMRKYITHIKLHQLFESRKDGIDFPALVSHKLLTFWLTANTRIYGCMMTSPGWQPDVSHYEKKFCFRWITHLVSEPGKSVCDHLKLFLIFGQRKVSFDMQWL